MSKVALIQVVYNSKKFIPIVFPKVFEQTFKDFEFYAVIAKSEDGSKEYIQEHFPQVKIIDPGYNIGFAKGHNQLFEELDCEFFQLINPDLVLTPNFVEEMLKGFTAPNVGAVSGKILHYDFEKNETTNIIDTTGVVVAKSGRGGDRGQHQVDEGQFDNQTNLIAVSGAAAMYRKAALRDIRFVRQDGSYEYYDEDFHSYWEDVDLSLRMINAGWKIKYQPEAVAYHGRAVGSQISGYKKVFAFIKAHRKHSLWIRQLNYKNHIFLLLKNFPKLYPEFLFREFFYQVFVLLLETATLKILPRFFKELPIMWQKRKYIQAHRKISVEDMEKLLS